VIRPSIVLPTMPVGATPEGIEAAGVTELALAFGRTDAECVRADMERFDREVLATPR